MFCRVGGEPLHPERFTRTFRDRVRQLGLPRSGCTIFRHGWATLALATGVHPKVAQERLGYATIGVTLDIYSHVTAGRHSDAADQVAAAMFQSGQRWLAMVSNSASQARKTVIYKAFCVSGGGLEPPRPLRALAPQASASAIPPPGRATSESSGLP